MDEGSEGEGDVGGSVTFRPSMGGGVSVATGATPSGGTKGVVMGGVSSGGFRLALGGFTSGGIRTTGGMGVISFGGARPTGGTASGRTTTCSCQCYCDACSGAVVKTCAAGDTSCATCRGPCIEFCAATPSCGGEVVASGSCMLSP